MYALKRNFTGQNDVTVKNANSSLMDTVALATIRVIMEINGTIAKVAGHKFPSCKNKKLITSGTKTQLLVFIQKRPFSRPFCMLLKMTYICKLLHFTFIFFKFYNTQTSTMHKMDHPTHFLFQYLQNVLQVAFAAAA